MGGKWEKLSSAFALGYCPHALWAVVPNVAWTTKTLRELVIQGELPIAANAVIVLNELINRLDGLDVDDFEFDRLLPQLIHVSKTIIEATNDLNIQAVYRVGVASGRAIGLAVDLREIAGGRPLEDEVDKVTKAIFSLPTVFQEAVADLGTVLTEGLTKGIHAAVLGLLPVSNGSMRRLVEHVVEKLNTDTIVELSDNQGGASELITVTQISKLANCPRTTVLRKMSATRDTNKDDPRIVPAIPHKGRSPKRFRYLVIRPWLIATWPEIKDRFPKTVAEMRKRFGD
jgi:hypothetical protein